MTFEEYAAGPMTATRFLEMSHWQRLRRFWTLWRTGELAARPLIVIDVWAWRVWGAVSHQNGEMLCAGPVRIEWIWE